MKLEFKKQIIGLDGLPLEGERNAMNKILANLLAYSSSGPMVKFMDWARDLTKDGSINIDRTDAEVLHAFVKDNETLPNITKEQIAEVVKKAINAKS